MLDIIIGLAMFIIFVKLLVLAIKCAWSLTKIVLTIVIFPLVLIGIFVVIGNVI